MYNNIIFSPLVHEDQENPREIDHNDLVEKKLSALKRKQEKDLRAKLQMDGQDDSGEPVLDENGEPVDMGTGDFGGADDPADFISEEQLKQMEEEAQLRADDILNNARQEAARIQEDAQREADAALANAMEKGREEGYQNGLIQAQNELNAKKAELDTNYSMELEKLMEERSAMEKTLVDTICNVVERVFKCQFSGKTELVMNLVTSALDHTDGSKNLLIRINPVHYDEFNEKIQELKNQVGEDVNISVTSDPIMQEDMCTIETDGGIFDCSLDVEMDNLMRDIRSLAQQ